MTQTTANQKVDDDVNRVGQQIAFHLEEIAKLFKPGVMHIHLNVASMRDAKPRDVLAWAQRHNIEMHLPVCYREAA